ncbi:MAG: DoxX family protein [Janthinobacterium lividum]
MARDSPPGVRTGQPDKDRRGNRVVLRIGLLIVFSWFVIGGLGHFLAPQFFLKIVPPQLPLRIEAVYISGAFELAGALGLWSLRSRRAACWGLLLLTVAVTPANFYMWQHPELFPAIPEVLLTLRLFLQAGLIWLIWTIGIRQR